MAQDTVFFIFQIIVLVYSVVLHELAHGYMARSMGDHTAERLGRLTLNPFSHLDLFGSFILPVLTYQFGGLIFGYAKPVPYDPDNLDDRQWGPSKVALAGPGVNLVLAVLAGLVIRLTGIDSGSLLMALLMSIVRINIVLMCFNLIPIPPLDGHWLLMAVLPPGYYRLKVALFQFQWLLLAVTILFIFPLLVPLMRALAGILTGQAGF